MMQMEVSGLDIKEFAKSINGREYSYSQFTEEELETAKENGFVIVYGASDDLMEFEGAMRNEGYCCEGGNVYFNKNGVIDDNDVTSFDKCIKAIWRGEEDDDGQKIAWTYETEIPHETFMIYDGGEPYCEGIVFSIDTVF